jgi:Gpi18-like mannosyltransferase
MIEKDKYPIYLLIIFVIQFVLFLAATYGGSFLMAINAEYNVCYHFFTDPRLYHSLPSLLDLLFPSDAQIYLRLAQNGYNSSFFLCWFPFFPIMIWMFNLIIHDLRISSLFVSNIATLTALFFLYYLLKKQYSPLIAFRTVLLLLVFPYSLYLHTGHSESIFLLLAVLSFFFWEKKNIYLTSLFSMLASITRPYGIVLFILFLFFYIKEFVLKKQYTILHIVSLLFIPIGLLAYSLYNRNLTGDFLFWMHNRAHLGQGGEPSFMNILKLNIGGVGHPLINEIILLFFVAFVLIYYFFFKRIKLNFIYWIYTFLLAIVPLVMNNLIGYGRFLTGAFPLFLFIVLYLNKNKITTVLYYLLVFLLLLGQMVLSIYSTNWYFIA